MDNSESNLRNVNQKTVELTARSFSSYFSRKMGFFRNDDNANYYARFEENPSFSSSAFESTSSKRSSSNDEGLSDQVDETLSKILEEIPSSASSASESTSTKRSSSNDEGRFDQVDKPSPKKPKSN